MKLKRLTAWLLLTACAFATACGKKTGNTDDSTATGPSATGVVKEAENMHYVEGTLHDVNVDFNAPVSDFVVNGQSDYTVVVGDTTKSRAAGYIVTQVTEATGAKLNSISLDDLTATVDENSQFIFVGCEDLYTSLGAEMPTYEKIGVAGYNIRTIGKNVFINAYSDDGYQMGVLAFLREVLGYDMFSEDLIIYEKDGKKMPAMDITERPDFDYRQANSTSVSTAEVYGMGYTASSLFIYTGESSMHNIYDFVSLEEADENPDWLSNDSTRWQMCWTSRGNKDTYAKLIDHITEKIKGYLIKEPTIDNICIGAHDIGTNTPQVQHCRCTACSASFDYYGGTYAGAWLSLCNRVSLQVDEWLQSEEAILEFGGVRDFNLLELVYHTSLNPPVEKNAAGNYVYDENGKGIPKIEMWFNNDGSMQTWDEAWTDENGNSLESGVVAEWTKEQDRIYSAPSIQFWWAASSADYTHSFYESQNESYANMVKGWAGVGGEFYCWLYALNSRGTLYPYGSFDTAFETTRFYKALGAKYCFWQGQYHNPKNGGFTRLRNYLDSKVEFDVNADYQFYLDKFFKYYYGAGGETIKEYFTGVMAQIRYIEQVNSVAIGHLHNNKYQYAENWPEGLVNTWNDLVNQAYDEIEVAHRNSDPEMYEVYKEHILIESYFPRYVLITSYADSYKASTLKAMRKEFINDYYALGNKYYGEGRLLTEVSDAWDLD